MTVIVKNLDGIGIAIFVKTPGFSPIKTRLAATIGHDAAEEFHRLAAAAVADVATDATLVDLGAVAYWAVAEADALSAPLWHALPRIAQGDGTLGMRMRTVYEQLRARHGAAILIGADAPQLRVEDLQATCTALRTQQSVIGPSDDGGFWLFGGRCAVPDDAWLRTPWSQSDTRVRFVTALGSNLPAALRVLRDVDTLEDLHALRAVLDTALNLRPAHRALATWLSERLS